ncbi:RhoGAP-domain-containing protein, partial [Aureobasidium melanogenum]
MDVATLRSQLPRAQQKIAELEADKLGLEEKMDTSADIKHANTELREKRSTMAFLDTQREMVVRELEIMTEHLTRAKESNKPLDISQLKSEILQDFAHSLQKLKDNLGSQIEDLVHKRNELTDDISNLIQVKDKGLQEFESLSSKNLQLAELNNQLVSGIQDLYKSQNKSGSIERSPLTNGLGIYNGSNRGDMTSLHSASLQESTSLHDL